jgi:uncharacterized membrane protein YeaQ/YmgE (transglycosylase-associated protein family)
MGFIWTIIIGFVAGLIARWLVPGPNNPSGFILTTLIGIVGAFLATFIGQAIGHYGPDQGAGLITSVIGAAVLLFIWHRLVAAGTSPVPPVTGVSAPSLRCAAGVASRGARQRQRAARQRGRQWSGD